MGPTGTGKTSFINLLTGSDLRIGDQLESCTREVQISEPFELDGRMVTLIDTPGFDDTNLSDTSVLNMIATYLSHSYTHGKHLAGVIYLHRILDNRVGGISTRNFRLFRKLCGDQTLSNVVIATTMWDQVEQNIGERREEELATKDAFFKPALDKGARMVRFDNNDAQSARSIVRSIIDRSSSTSPIVLQIQDELSRGIDIADTHAGRELREELFEQITRHREEMRGIIEDMQETARCRDEESRQELEQERIKIERLLTRLQQDSANISEGYREALARLEERFLSAGEAGSSKNNSVKPVHFPYSNGFPRDGGQDARQEENNNNEQPRPTVQAVAATENSNAVLEGKLAAAIPVVGFWGRISVMLAPFSLTWR